MRQKIIIPLAALTLLLAFGVVSAKAVQSTTAQQKKVQVKEEFQALKEKLEAKKCANVEKQVQNRLQRFDNQQLIHLASYQKTRTLISGKLDRLEENGYKVDALRDDLKNYDILVEKFKTDYTAYKGALVQVKTMACGDTEGEIKTQLSNARGLLKTVHEDAVQIRTFWAKTMKDHFLALKDQKPAGTEADTDTTNDNTNESGE